MWVCCWFSLPTDFEWERILGRGLFVGKGKCFHSWNYIFVPTQNHHEVLDKVVLMSTFKFPQLSHSTQTLFIHSLSFLIYLLQSIFITTWFVREEWERGVRKFVVDWVVGRREREKGESNFSKATNKRDFLRKRERGGKRERERVLNICLLHPHSKTHIYTYMWWSRTQSLVFSKKKREN